MSAGPAAPVPVAPRPARSARRELAARRLREGAWIAAYLAMVAFPLLILLRGPLPKGGGFWWDFAMALGFGGLALLGLQAGLTARFRRATAPFGVDIIYYFHRLAALAGAGLVLGHYLILRIAYADTLGPANPLTAAWPMTAGRIALGLFALLVVTALGRRQLGIEYDRWRLGHAALAAGGVGCAMAHIWGVGHYTAAVARGLPWALFSLLWLLVVVYIRLGRPWTLLREPYRVTAIAPERGKSWTLTLAPVGHRGLRFSPGQFAWLALGANPFRAREHPFSISSSAEKTDTLQFTIKELGDFTRTIGRVPVGTVAYVDGPHGVFTPDRQSSAGGFVFVAGGVGIAPIMSMLRTLADRGERRPLRLVYGNRRWEDVVFREELEALRARLALEVAHVLQEPPPGWPGARGLLGDAVLRAAIPPEARAAVFFLCGPKPMSDAVQRTLRDLGVPLHRIHCERFEMA